MKNLKNMSKSILSLLGVGYYDTKLFRLECNTNGDLYWQEAPVGFKPKILILSRNLYKESNKQYPIDNLSEVKKLVKLELSSETGANQFICYQPVDGKISTNKWHFDEIKSDAKIIIPESFLIGINLDYFTTVELKTNVSKSYIVRTPNGIISATQGGLIADVNSFSMASGVTVQAESEGRFQSLSFDKMAELVGLNLPQVLLKYGKAFYVNPKNDRALQDLVKPLFISVFSVFFLYLILSSAYLVFQEWRITAKLENSSDEVNQALLIQNEYNKLTTELVKQQSFIDTQSIKTPFWTVVEPLFQEASFRSIRFRNQRFVLNGETEQATRLLELLISNPLVEDAKFDNQVRKSRRNEVFIISFRLKEVNNGDI